MFLVLCGNSNLNVLINFVLTKKKCKWFLSVLLRPRPTWNDVQYILYFGIWRFIKSPVISGFSDRFSKCRSLIRRGKYSTNSQDVFKPEYRTQNFGRSLWNTLYDSWNLNWNEIELRIFKLALLLNEYIKITLQLLLPLHMIMLIPELQMLLAFTRTNHKKYQETWGGGTRFRKRVIYSIKKKVYQRISNFKKSKNNCSKIVILLIVKFWIYNFRSKMFVLTTTTPDLRMSITSDRKTIFEFKLTWKISGSKDYENKKKLGLSSASAIQLTTSWGWTGPSSAQTWTRLYLNLDLRHYIMDC